MEEALWSDDDPSVSESEPDNSPVCQPCEYDGEIADAEGFCLDCSEHMCATCLTCHKKMSMSRHHKLVGKEDMPTEQGNTKDVCTEKCQSHDDKVIEYFYPTHRKLGCTVCVAMIHKLCDYEGYIPEISKDIETSEDYAAFQTRLKNLMMKSKMIIQAAADNTETLHRHYTKVLEDFETYKQEILDMFNRLQQDIRNRIEEIQRVDTERMNTALDTGNSILETLQEMEDGFESLLANEQYCKMFIDMKHAEETLNELNDKLNKENASCLRMFQFEAGEQLQMLLRKQDACGTVVEKRPNKTILSHVTDVNVRTKRDGNTCCITGSVILSENRLVLTDFENDTIKLYDTVHNKVISKLKTSGWKCDVARVSQNEVAVTKPYEHSILILTCDYKFIIDQEIKVNGTCRGIDCVQDKLFVAYDTPAKVEILSLSGELLQSFDTNKQGIQLFSNPRYVCVNPRNQSIYVSDWHKNSVLQLDMDGNVFAEYKDDELKKPCKMAFDAWGNVYLCGGNSHNVHLLTPECKKVKILLDGIREPHSICSCDYTNKLYIGMWSDKNVKIYQIK